MEQALDRGPVDLIVLDVMLPGEDGLAICRRLAGGDNAPPIIMLSAMGEDTDRIVGLELGADDYLPKPCNPRELLARVRAVLRRAEERASSGPPTAGCEFAGWRLDLVRRELRSPQRRGGQSVVRRVLPAARLRRAAPAGADPRPACWSSPAGPDSDAFDRAIDVQISRLRRKLDDGGRQDLIRTIRNEGYMFTAKVRRT
jgi:two-component system OmpR family response regulator